MDANSGLLQYYVHHLLKYRRQDESGAVTPTCPPKQFRSRTKKSFLVHEYNFLKNATEDDSLLLRSPVGRSGEFYHVKGAIVSPSRKHRRRASLQSSVRQELTQVVRKTDIEFYQPQVQGNTPTAIRTDTPPRTVSYDPEAQHRLGSGKCDNFSGLVSENSRQGTGTARGCKRGTALLGLQIRRLELERDYDVIEREKHNKPALSPTKADERPFVKHTAAVFSQELIRPNKRRQLERTIFNFSEETHDTVFEQKARNYRDMLFIVYLGCGSYRDAELCSAPFDRKQDVKYEYYVGRGNNANLIHSLMKKRWWWQSTNEITLRTKFVWTQRKVDGFFERQPKGDWSVLEAPVLNKTPLKHAEAQYRLENQQELRRLLHSKDVEIYKQYARTLRKQPHSLAARVKLLRKRPMHLLTGEPCLQNHFECNFHLGNKKALLSNLTNYYKFHGVPLEHWNIPLTFHCTSPHDAEFKHFATVFRQRDRINRKNNVWIVKPGENSNRGQGIKVSRSLKQITAMLQNSEHTYVVQQYIGNLLLYQRRKFDIRTYCLLTRVGGVLKAYWYQEGYVRTSSSLYQLDDLSDPMVHLTNDAIQKHGQNYGKYQPGNKLSYVQLQRYLDGMFPQNPLYDVDKLVERMKIIATEAVRSCYFRLDPHCRSYNFEVFGLDFIIDDSFRPWLLEVNTNPCLELSSPLLARLIPQMVDNALRLGLDPLYPPTPSPYNFKPYLTDNSIERNRFELIFDSQYDRQPAYENGEHDHCSYDNDDELFDNEGQLLNVTE